jgi:hypothetical protein
MQTLSPSAPGPLNDPVACTRGIKGLTDATITGFIWSLEGEGDCLRLVRPKNVTIELCTFFGPAAEGAGLATGSGLTIIDGENVTVRQCRFDGTRNGLNVVRCVDFTLDGCEVVRFGANGLMISEGLRPKVLGSFIHDPKPLAGEHLDAVQLASPDPTRNIDPVVEPLIAGNIIAGQCQGVFGQGVVRGVVRDNQIRVSFANAIGLRGASDLLLADNDIRTLAQSDMQARFNLTDASYRCEGRNHVAEYRLPSGRVMAAYDLKAAA